MEQKLDVGDEHWVCYPQLWTENESVLEPGVLLKVQAELAPTRAFPVWNEQTAVRRARHAFDMEFCGALACIESRLRYSPTNTVNTRATAPKFLAK
mmetsp:Transcript_8389/g.25463  ORF Transcript_8389/g.25463 Transcript_8389/m.25463 type:complete len:96 (-) Transcript_8389:32-319(-)